MTQGSERIHPAPQVAYQHYADRAYNSKERFCSFWHQVDEVLSAGAESVLEVGPGGGHVTGELRRTGLNVTTLDIADDTSPDLVGSVTKIPLADRSVDVALASQILEHVPLRHVEQALSELARVSRKRVVVSVPNQTPFIGGSYPLYFGPYIEGVRPSPPASVMRLLSLVVRRQMRLRDAAWVRLVPQQWAIGGRSWQFPALIPHQPTEFEFDGEYYWELGTQSLDAAGLCEMMSGCGLSGVRDFRVPENPWHHFFIGTKGDC